MNRSGDGVVQLKITDCYHAKSDLGRTENEMRWKLYTDKARMILERKFEKRKNPHVLTLTAREPLRPLEPRTNRVTLCSQLFRLYRAPILIRSPPTPLGA
jgi:hypothetical protein